MLLIIYFIVGTAFLYVGRYSEKYKNNFESKLRLIMITVAWPICVAIFIIRIIVDRKLRDKVIDDINTF